MPLDMRTIRLFSPPIREVGFPERKRVNSVKEIEEYVDLNNGVSKAMFCSVYDLRLNIDKIFFDFDGPLARKAVEKMILYLYELGQEPLVTFTGKKGYHLWLILKQEKDSTPEDLRHATLCLLKDCDLLTSTGGHTSGLPVDSTCIGEIRRFGRIPNTLRPPDNKFWCTWLPKEFIQWSKRKIEQWAQRPHYFDDFPKRILTLSDLKTHDYETVENEYNQHMYNTTKTIASNIQITEKKVSKESLVQLFSPFMSKRVAERIVYVPEPLRTDRFVAAKSLLESGFNAEQILDMFAKCAWVDFNPELALQEIIKIDQPRYVDRDRWKKRGQRK